ncbi:rCG62330 [Rattus norvegicus]|uniref:RCG62330 n=1 Tax=Rattus norvegicus TaxID=10116 RepID=A6HAK1_RAT|nr:rCG62330 [Rattus norvegicus]
MTETKWDSQSLNSQCTKYKRCRYELGFELTI